MLRRVVGYWGFCLLSIFSVAFYWEYLQQPEAEPQQLFETIFARYAPALIGSLVLLPFVLYDALKITHRIAGPIYRLRKAMGKILAGETVGAVRFRDGDYFHEIAEEFNRVKDLIPDQSAADFEEPWSEEDEDELRIDDVVLRR